MSAKLNDIKMHYRKIDSWQHSAVVKHLDTKFSGAASQRGRDRSRESVFTTFFLF